MRKYEGNEQSKKTPKNLKGNEMETVIKKNVNISTKKSPNSQGFTVKC